MSRVEGLGFRVEAQTKTQHLMYTKRVANSQGFMAFGLVICFFVRGSFSVVVDPWVFCGSFGSNFGF